MGRSGWSGSTSRVSCITPSTTMTATDAASTREPTRRTGTANSGSGWRMAAASRRARLGRKRADGSISSDERRSVTPRLITSWYLAHRGQSEMCTMNRHRPCGSSTVSSRKSEYRCRNSEQRIFAGLADWQGYYRLAPGDVPASGVMSKGLPGGGRRQGARPGSFSQGVVLSPGRIGCEPG